MLAATKSAFEFDELERERLEGDGFVVREDVFSAAELGTIGRQCEDLLAQLEAAKHKQKTRVGSYMFEELQDEGVIVKWEPNAPDVVQGLEPFAHVCEPLRRWGVDPRLVDPSKTVVGQDDVMLFTEKLNVKRARFGGDIVLHQDYPYWEPINAVAHRVGTAMVFLDDADTENGCLEIASGTHRTGKFKQRDVEGFGALEMDTDAFDLSRLKPLEAKAGTVVFFGPYLVHRSLPNRSARDRRALLYSYQPAGYPPMVELNRMARRKSAGAVQSGAGSGGAA